MAHFAFINDQNIVEKVLVIDQETVNTGLFGDPAKWIQTSYNTRGGVHYGPDNEPDDGVPLRKNFAGIGYTYDPVSDAFYAPQPYPSWILNKTTYIWEAPVPLPDNQNYYIWNEKTLSWIKVG